MMQTELKRPLEMQMIQREILRSKSEGEFSAAVGLSREWDARKAGREVASDALAKLKGKKPDVFLVFSTIHYEKHGGFKELLKGIWEILPEGTPLIGGTIAGFIVPQGCFTRGVVALVVSSKRIDLAIGVEKNIKRNPKGSASKCADKIRKNLTSSKFKNKFLLNLPSGITTPKIPGFPDNLRVIRHNSISKLLLIGTRLSLILLQKGPGRESQIIEKLSEKLPEYQIIGGSFIDDNKGYNNYQFYNNEVYTNALITLGISTDYDINVNSSFGLTETSHKFTITKKSTYDLIIEKINGKKAFDEMLKILNWPDYFLEDSARLLRRTFYTPIGYTVDGKKYISVMAFIFGDNIMVSPEIKANECCIMAASGKDLINSIESNLADTKDKNIKLGLMVSCIVHLETLGPSIYKVHEKLINHFKEKPFIQIYTVGEDVYTQKTGAKRIAESYNSAVFTSEK